MKHCSLLILFSISSANLFAEEGDVVKVLQHPQFSLLDRFTLDVGLTSLPLDAFYKPLLLDLGLQYQYSDLFSFDLVRFGYSIVNFNTGLQTSIENEVTRDIGRNVDLENRIFKDFRFRVSSDAYVNLLYSKSNLFNRKIIYHQWQVGGGLSYFDFKSKNQLALDLAARVRFFIDKNWLVNLSLGHSIGFKSDAPQQIMYIGLGGSFAF